MSWSAAGNIRGPEGPAGPTGATGPTGAAGAAGPAGLTWRGIWSAANSYATNDLVSWGGSSYFATGPRGTNTAPPTGSAGAPGSDDTAINTGWQLLAMEGAQGPEGPTGPTGATGAQGIQGLQGIQGVAGPAGSTGGTGSTGATGSRGSYWYTGIGAPGTISGAQANDQYLDLASGNVYTFF